MGAALRQSAKQPWLVVLGVVSSCAGALAMRSMATALATASMCWESNRTWWPWATTSRTDSQALFWTRTTGRTDAQHCVELILRCPQVHGSLSHTSHEVCPVLCVRIPLA